MISAWNRYLTKQQKTWVILGGAIVAGTVIKVSYFKFSRNLVISDDKEQLEEAQKEDIDYNIYQQWRKEDTRARVPQLTNEQKEQLQEYFLLIEKHTNDMVDRGYTPSSCTYDHPTLQKNNGITVPPAPYGTVQPMDDHLMKRFGQYEPYISQQKQHMMQNNNDTKNIETTTTKTSKINNKSINDNSTSKKRLMLEE